jgi:hypothetical protein
MREGSEETLSDQFRCITFHPSRYGGRVKITPGVKNKWADGWASSWFYSRVPLHKGEARGKGAYIPVAF